MDARNLWEKFFTAKTEKEEIDLHSAGATVRHHSPFEEIEVPRNKEGLSEEFINKLVIPFYMSNLSDADEVTIKAFADAAREINIDIARKLLGDFNWRTRLTGALFAAINNYRALEDIIGGHLLKSEVCYAGAGYCIALAAFGSDHSKKYLRRYLEYYLERKDLWFDQADALAALIHLDKEQAVMLEDKWDLFVADKPYWNLENAIKAFQDCMLTIDKIRQEKANI